MQSWNSPKIKNKKFFRKATNSSSKCIRGGVHPYTNTKFPGFSRSVGTNDAKIPLFAILRYFLRLYRCFWYNYTFKGYKALK